MQNPRLVARSSEGQPVGEYEKGKACIPVKLSHAFEEEGYWRSFDSAPPAFPPTLAQDDRGFSALSLPTTRQSNFTIQ